ncbi:hypothetical protein C8Q75DRAFT_437647 [Abortiporus biennis]|nr:hypothetical protein C8Q75DRAFT_437647 [Abortiporus biennis]
MARRAQTNDPILEAKLATLKAAITKTQPFASGIVPASTSDLTLFYGKDKNARRIENIAEATAEEIADLAAACDPAKFGLNDQNVLDESYRKAGQLNASQFCSTFDLRNSGIIEKVRDELITQSGLKYTTRAELYNLNVYGPGSFFKAHKDTPRAESMFGSLVIALPYPHEGGGLALRDDDREWVFNFADDFKDEAGNLTIPYVVFYSDTEHEVLPVTAGYRITITYNLYRESYSLGDPVSNTLENFNDLEVAFENLLADKTFLPDGGHLGFGLHYQYPFDKNDKDALKKILNYLKGKDAKLSYTCDQLELKVVPHLLFQDGLTTGGLWWSNGSGAVLIDRVPNLQKAYIENGSASYYFAEQYKGKIIKKNRDYEDDPSTEEVKVHWVVGPNARTKMDAAYTVYGNEAATAFNYGCVCLIVTVPPYGQSPRARAVDAERPVANEKDDEQEKVAVDPGEPSNS